MSLSTSEVGHLMAVIAVVVIAAHTMAHIFTRLRQPAVIGEILAGLVFGPTVLGVLAADQQARLFPDEGLVATVLAALAQLGLLLLMFVTGSEIRIRAVPGERRTIGLVAGVGLVLPFAVGLAIVPLIDYADLTGPSGGRTTTTLIFGIAVAVTSIPVISRIMLDLGILRQPFARLVLSVAAIEDVLLYGVLALVLSLAHTPATEDFGLWALLDVESTAMSVAYHVTITFAFVGLYLLYGPTALRWLLYGPASAVTRRNPAAFRIAVLLLTILICTLLGINPIFGALLTGLSARRADLLRAGPEDSTRGVREWETIRQFSLAFFVPIYFFVVGLNLDLIRNFDPVFFLWFFVLCCVVKAASVLAGALLAGQSLARSIDLSVALNARGGPGIVLASVTLAAGLVTESFFTSMVLLAVLTSQIAGFWLERRLPALITVAESRDPSGAAGSAETGSGAADQAPGGTADRPELPTR
jgi:Kef-type K+ transport system membrane component KefB